MSGCGSGSSAGSSNKTDKALAAGLAAQQHGALSAAKSLYQQVLDAQPGNVYAHYNLGVIAQRAGKSAEALGDYEAALKTNPNYVPALFNEAVIEQTNDTSKALALYRRILTLQPVAPTAQLNLGLLEARLGQTKQADVDLSKAVQEDPSLATSGMSSGHQKPSTVTSPGAGPSTTAPSTTVPSTTASP